MDSSSIDLPGSEIEKISVVEDRVVIRFSRAYVMRTMSGSDERTRWHQVGELIFEGASVEGEYPTGLVTCAGGDVGENVYTYRDMIPIPFKSAGRTFCDLRFNESDLHLRVEGHSINLVMEDRPQYIEHLRSNS
jgi:hypothetical protein